jgi:hypothetical protein
MTANKQKANLKNIQCSHQWGDLLFGHNMWKSITLALDQHTKLHYNF